LDFLPGHIVYVSTLSVHIFCYIYKVKFPNPVLKQQIFKFHLIDLSKKILENALAGPTPDLEDNIQLHSAAAADCDIFLTSDENLLKMKFFGKAKISSVISR
jgi:hypothetical protein